jgi:hypothetical protein
METKRMKHAYWILPVLMAFLPSLVTQSAEPFDPPARAQAVAPYIDDQTIAVAHVDLQKGDVAAAFQLFADLIEWPEEQRAELAEHQQAAQTWRNAMLAAGGRNVYLLVSLVDIPQSPPRLLVPLREGADVQAISALLFSGRKDGPASREELPASEQRRPRPIEVCERVGDMLFAGTQSALERIRNLRPSARPGLAAAFEAAGDTAAQVLILPSDDQRRVVREILPAMPPPLAGSGATLADGLKWAALGIDVSPKPAVKLTIQSADEKAAAELGEWIARGFELLSNLSSVKAAVSDFARLRPAVVGDRLTLTLGQEDGILSVLIQMFLLPGRLQHAEVGREHAKTHLKQWGLAMHNYHDTHKRLPPAATYAADDKPLLSWRVHLLPFVEEAELYKQFRLDEPWDSEHNRRLISQMPAVYARPGSKLARQGYTTYLAPIGPQTAFPGKTATKFQDFTGGLSHAILLVEVPDEQAVVWTKPEDWEVDWENPKQGLFGAYENGTHVLIADGSVLFLSVDVDDAVLKSLLTIALPEK